MKKINQVAISIVLLALLALPARAQTFTSLHIFGDSISATTNNVSNLSYYYGKRFSNGRVWEEVLAQRLGMGANSITNATWSNNSNNWSYFGQYSWNLVTNINAFPKPADAGTSLFIVWVNDADMVADWTLYLPSTNAATWNNAIAESLNNHWSIITNLYYAKGARTLIMPNAVDIAEIPEYDGAYTPAIRNFVRQEVINFNEQFAALLQQAQNTLPGLTIYKPNFFGLLDNVLTNSAAYGLVNQLYNDNGDSISIDAVDYYALENEPSPAMNGPAADYIFWDPEDPTAKVHEIMADIVQQMIAPVQLAGVTVNGPISGETLNQLDIMNTPVGLGGFVDGTTNLMQPGWTMVTNFNSVSTTQSVFVYAPPLPPIVLPSGTGSIYPGGGGTTTTETADTITNSAPNLPPPSNSVQSYRLRFPFAWTWP